MQLEWLKKLSLKAKMALAATGLFLLFVVTSAYFAASYVERAFKESIFTQQFSLVANMADNIDDKLRIAHNALKTVAATASRDVFTNPVSAQRFLDDKVGLLALFDNGIFFIDNKGILIAESPYRPKRRGRDLSFRDWVQNTVSGRKPYISDAYISTHTPGQPAIVMTVPVFDQKGEMTGMMTGSLDLLGENLLAQLSRARIGNAGYFFIIDKKRTLIVHADKERIMKPAAAAGVNRLVDMAFSGFEGSGETVTSYGVPMLLSSKHLQTTSWILGANYPIAEAYAPLARAKKYLAIAALAGTVMLLLASWFVMRRLLSPLAVLTRHVTHLPEKAGVERLLTCDSKDEIGVLVSAFNTMIATQDGQQEALIIDIAERKRVEEALQLQTTRLELEVAERQKAREFLLLKQQQLEDLNDSLEGRVIQAVAELRRKDQLMIQQGRLAAMGEMINNIAHQWRQPLNNIGLIVQNLRDSFRTGMLDATEMDEQTTRTMQLIMHMSGTINDFRNFFLEDKERRAFTVNRAVAGALDFLQPSLKSSGIEVEWSEQPELTVDGYPNEYLQAMLNIVNNARDVLLERLVIKPRISIAIFREDDRVVVTISDNGGGIVADVLPKVFDPYFTTKKQGKGTGIGLYMSKTIIEQNMAGSLTARNSGDGAEFRIELRAVAADQRAEG